MEREGMPMTRDEALLWLNDRLGKDVAIIVEVGRRDPGIAVVEVHGRLHHWRELHESGDDEPRDDAAGWYSVGAGDARFDLTALDHVPIWSYVHGGIVHRLLIELSSEERGAVFLDIIEQADRP